MQNLSDKKLCTGCTACVNICPVKCLEMEMDAYGFAYPCVTDLSKCVSCGLCEAVCPVQKRKPCTAGKPVALAAYTKNSEIRAESSSGGAFSEIASEIIDRGGIVFGAAFDQDFQVRHIGVEKSEDLYLLRGAKYSESRLGNVFSEISLYLKSGRYVLFSGTPCQTAGLKAFLKKEYENLLCIDFICHGIPSPAVWEKYVLYRSQKDNGGELPIQINLRDKESGWSHYRYTNVFRYRHGNEHREISSDSIYMRLFTQDYILRQSCERCQFKGYSHTSDFTLGDFWGIWDIMPDMDDNRGTSLIIIQSEKAWGVWEAVKDHFVFRAAELEQTSVQNPSILKSALVRKERVKILNKLCRCGFQDGMTFQRLTNSLQKRIRRWIKKTGL